MKNTPLPRCGWCPGTPTCVDKGELYQCASCKRNYPKPLDKPKKSTEKPKI